MEIICFLTKNQLNETAITVLTLFDWNRLNIIVFNIKYSLLITFYKMVL